jgi:hypothetical protein
MTGVKLGNARRLPPESGCRPSRQITIPSRDCDRSAARIERHREL